MRFDTSGGVLHASNLINVRSVKGVFYYQTVSTETFIDLSSLEGELIAVFRRHHLQHNPERLLDV